MSNVLNISYTSAPWCYLESTFKSTTDNTGQYFPANQPRLLKAVHSSFGDGETRRNKDNESHKRPTIIIKILTVLCSCDENNTATSLQVLLNMERYQQWNTVLEFII